MDRQLKISVLMPVYNSEKYLAEAVRSVLRQTFTDFEFVIVNDGSTDHSEEILRTFEKQDTRIRVVSRGNTGIVAALNEGLKYTTGEYISRVDSDDIALPEMLAKQLSFLDGHPEYVAVGQQVLIIDPNGAPIRIANELVTHEDIDKAHMQGQGAFPHSGSMIRRNAIQTVGGYRKEVEFAEDIDLWLRLAEIGKLSNLPEVLLKYRLHLKSIGHTRRNVQVQATKQLLIDAHRRRGLPLPEISNMSNEHQDSISEISCRWAWWALISGNIATARRYAFSAVKIEPMSKHAWKTLFYAIRGW